MEKNNGAVIASGLSVVFALVIGFVSYGLGVQNGARTMHADMMNIDTGEGAPKPKPAMPMDHSDMTMDQMTEGLDGLQGDAFDRAFIEMMIVHHQGAVDMAERIPESAKHAELKKLGEDIILAQTREIKMMKDWLKAWGYEDGAMMKGGMPMKGMDHSQMGM